VVAIGENLRKETTVSATILVGQPLTIEDVVRVACHRAPVALDDIAREHVRAARRYIEHVLAEERVVYGVTTGARR